MRNVTDFQNAIISNACGFEPVARALGVLSGLVSLDASERAALCETLERVAENARVAHPNAFAVVEAPRVAGGGDFFDNAPADVMRALATRGLTKGRNLYRWICDIEAALFADALAA